MLLAAPRLSEKFVATAGVTVLHLGLALWIIFQTPKASEPLQVIEMTASILAPSPLPPQARPVQQAKPPTAPVKQTPTPLVSKTVDTAPAPNAPTAPPAPSPVSAAERTVAAPAAPSAPRFDAAYLNNPPPPYPALSRRMGEQGKVMLNVVVGPDGLPREVKVLHSSGFPRLDEAARSAVERWRFVPAKQGDQPVVASVNVPINFKLD